MSLSSVSICSTTVSSVSRNSAEVPGVTFFFHVIDDSSLIPMSIIEVLSAPIAAPIAAPRNGTRKRNPRNIPQKAPPSAPCFLVSCS